MTTTLRPLGRQPFAALALAGCRQRAARRRPPCRSRSSCWPATTATATCHRRRLGRPALADGRWAAPQRARGLGRAPWRRATPDPRGGGRRRLHRRIAAGLRAVPRRAHGRGALRRHRRRLHRRRQPQVARQGRGRWPAARSWVAEQPAGPGQLQKDLARSRPARSTARASSGCPRTNVLDAADKLLAYGIETFDGVQVSEFIGMTLKATPGIMSPSSIAGLQFRDKADASSAARPAAARKASRRSSSSCTRAACDPARRRRHQRLRRRACGKENADGSESDIGRIVRRLDDAVDLVISAHTHAAYNCWPAPIRRGARDGRPTHPGSSGSRRPAPPRTPQVPAATSTSARPAHARRHHGRGHRRLGARRPRGAPRCRRERHRAGLRRARRADRATRRRPARRVAAERPGRRRPGARGGLVADAQLGATQPQAAAPRQWTS